jgi:lysophospholipid acyltransferase (LPLAT)-like uncharacterized protein
MKRFLRSDAVQSILAFLLSTYIGFTVATMRWRFENRAVADAAAALPKGAIACFWHGRIALAMGARAVLGAKPRRVLISLSRDGEFIAKAVKRLGFLAIRGSTGNSKEKGGAAAFMEALRFIAGGGVILITPDGPRGPNEVMPNGPVLLARVAKTPVFLFGLAARPAAALSSWDRTRIPLPFSRGCVVFDGPLSAPATSDPAAIEACRAEWQARLIAAQARAEAILAGTV